MNIFEYASRNKLIFASAVGFLTTEQLWDLPLTSSKSANLNDIAIACNTALQEATKTSFVPTANSNAKDAKEHLAKLDVVRHIISVKVDEASVRQASKAKAVRKTKLIETLDRKNNEAMDNLSREEILAEIEAL
ncbi:MAG: hypothetical protein COA63_014235 [Methylophaga sp.]|nr:hypothetical protein [Methylophaga sp.]